MPEGDTIFRAATQLRKALVGTQFERRRVYGRSGKPCLVCGTTVRMRRQGLAVRSTCFCPTCQCGTTPLGPAP